MMVTSSSELINKGFEMLCPLSVHIAAENIPSLLPQDLENYLDFRHAYSLLHLPLYSFHLGMD